MRRQETGFTLIELVIVLVILGILAAVAVPQFYDATADAERAAITGGKSAVASAIAIQVARSTLKTTPTVSSVATELGLPTSDCSAGFLEIPGATATRGVKLSLRNAAGATVVSCDAQVIGVVTATFTAI